jgi:hypothetical protein
MRRVALRDKGPSPGRRGWVAAAVLAAILLLALLAWLQSDPPGREARAVAGLPSAGRPAGAAPGAGATPPADKAGTVELCGYGRVAPIRTIDDYPAGVVAAAEAAMERIAADLLGRPQAREQAVGHYAQLVAAMRAAGAEFERRNPQCDDEACARRRRQAAELAAAPAAQALARLAVASQDPTAYALALYGCRLNRDGACAQLTAARWAQLAPDNAVPWFVVAEEAHQGKDEAALAEALHRAALAKFSDYDWSALLVMADDPKASALAPASRLVFLTSLIGIYAALPTPGYSAASEACSRERLGDAARRQLCGDLATMMTERSGSLLEFSLGTSIGERAGWPAERVQRLRNEKEAVFMVSARDWIGEDVHSCRFLEQLEARTREFATLGELRAGRQRIAASGRPVTALAAEWRELQVRQREAVQRQEAAGAPDAAARSAQGTAPAPRSTEGMAPAPR